MLMIYIREQPFEKTRSYLMDWVVSEGHDHPIFTTMRASAMTFENMRRAEPYCDKLRTMRYEVHVEPVKGGRT